MKFQKLFIVIILLFLIFPIVGKADGFTFKVMPDGDISQVEQKEQRAFINHHDGQEEMIIGVDLEKRSSEALWIVPVPSNPEEIKVDIKSKLPVFFGDEVNAKAKVTLSNSIEDLHEVGLSNQIWTLPLTALELVTLGGARGGAGGSANISSGDLISVNKHIEKKGMTAEIITAKRAKALYGYLKNKGLSIKRDSIPKLENYTGEKYTFIVSWLSSPSKVEEETRGVHVTFPTSKIYYPLHLTSAYGESKLPITIRVVGHVKPDLFPEIKDNTKVEYFTNRTSPGRRNVIRCTDMAHKMRSFLEIYYNEHGNYPSSLDELGKFQEEHIGIENYTEKLNETCWGPVSYEGENNNYKAEFYISSGEIYEISSDESGKTKEIESTRTSFFSSMGGFYGNSKAWKGEDEYTKITINAPAKNLKEDLTMKKGKPLKTSLALWVGNNSLKVTAIIYFVLVSILSYLIAGTLGFIYFRKFKKYSLLGLSNIFTLLAFYFVLRHSGIEDKNKCSRRKFLFTFSIVFILLFSAVTFQSMRIGGLLTVIATLWIVLGLFTRWLTNYLLGKIDIDNTVIKFGSFLGTWSLLTYIIWLLFRFPEWITLIFPIIQGALSAWFICWIIFKLIWNKSKILSSFAISTSITLFDVWLLKKIMGEDLGAHLFNLIHFPQGSYVIIFSIIALFLAQVITAIIFCWKHPHK